MTDIINDAKNTILLRNQLALWYLGQAGFLLKISDKYLLFDAFLLNMPGKRLYPPPIDPYKLDFVDYVLCSHGHLDHMDPETLGIMPKVNNKAKYIVPKPTSPKAISLGVPQESLIEAVADSPLMLGALKITPIPAAHEELHKDCNGNYSELGYITEINGFKLYHSGDCCLYDGLKERLLPSPDIVLLPINGRDYYRFRSNCIGNMDTVEALRLASDIKADLLIPMHYDLFDGNTVSPAYFVDSLYRYSPEQKFKLFMLGEKLIYQII